MSIPVPVKTPRKGPGSGRDPHPQPVLPPDDPNADRIDRESDIDPPPTDPSMEAPSEKPGTERPPARACLWMTIGPFLPACGSGAQVFAGMR